MHYILFGILATIWGGSFVAIKIIVVDLSPFLGAALRVGLALTFLSLFYVPFSKPFQVPSKLRGKVWLGGLFLQGIPFALLFWGEKAISPGLAGILNGTVPLWTFGLGLIFLRSHEPFSIGKFLGLLMGVLGLAFIFLPKIEFGGSSGELLGALAICGMSFSYGIGTLLNRYVLSGPANLNLYGVIFQQHLAGLAFLLLMSVGFEGSPQLAPLWASGKMVTAILYLSLFSNVIAWFMYLKLIRDWGAVRASAVTYVVPVMAILSDFLFFRNLPTLWEGLGALTILAGVLLIQLSAHRARESVPKALFLENR